MTRLLKALTLLACAALMALPLAAQPDCSFTFNFTGAATQTAVSNLSQNTPCVNWRLTLSTTGTLSATVTFYTSPDNITFTAVPNTVCSSTVQPPCVLQGANPIVGTQGMLYSASYGSYVQVVVTSPSGAGTGTVRGYGAKGASAGTAVPGLNAANFVPYTGATQAVILGANTVSAINLPIPVNPICDGVTDGSAAIQAGLDTAHANGGGRVTVPVHTSACGIASQLTIYGGTVLDLQGRSNKIKAIAAFPTSTPLVRLGDGTVYTFGARIENGTLDCNNITGSIGVFSNAAQEQSGYRDMVITQCLTSSKFSGLTGVGVSNTSISDSELVLSVAFSGAAKGHIIENSAWKNEVRGVTFIPNDGVTTQAAGLYLSGAATTNVYSVHCEYLVDCVKFDGVAGPSAGLVTGLDGQHLTNAVTINSAGRVTLADIQVTTSTNVVNNTQLGTITNNTTPLYVFDSSCEHFFGGGQFLTTCPAQIGKGLAGGTMRFSDHSGNTYAFNLDTITMQGLQIKSEAPGARAVTIDGLGVGTWTFNAGLKLPTACTGLSTGTLYNLSGVASFCP